MTSEPWCPEPKPVDAPAIIEPRCRGCGFRLDADEFCAFCGALPGKQREREE